MPSKSKKLKTVPMFPVGGTIDYKMKDYSNDPVFVKKTEEVRKLLDRLIIPKELLEEMKKSSEK